MELTRRSKLSQALITVFTANLINMVFSVLINILLPKYLSIETYSAIKTYQLLILYVGLLHFGYNDSMYLKYGGVSLNKIDVKYISTNISTIRIFQIIIMMIVILLSRIWNNNILLFVAITIPAINMTNYYKFLYQASGEFRLYGRIINAVTVTTFIVNGLLLLFRTEKYSVFLLSYILLNNILFIFIETHFHKYINTNKLYLKFSIYELIVNIKTGFLLMLGNFMSIMMTSLDRWFIKITFDVIAFAQYSFAVSMENFLNVIVTPIGVSLYNYFCNTIDIAETVKMRSYVTVLAAYVIALAFPVKFIIEHYLVNYASAIGVLFFLFASQFFHIIIKCIYTNLYKARKLQNKYFSRLLLVIGIGVILNISFYYIFRDYSAYSIATLITSFIWYFVSIVDFIDVAFTVSELVFGITQVIALIVFGFYFNSICGLLVYLVFTSSMVIILMRDVIVDLRRAIKRL